MGTWMKRVSGADWLAVGLLLVLPGLFFWMGLVAPTEFIREDAASYFQPYYAFAADEVQAGRIPLWNPYCALGIPFHAGLQPSLFYPPRWPLFWMDYIPGYVFLLWMHFFLLGLAAYVLMRVALGVGPLAGLLGAVSITFSGFTLGHWTHLTYVLGYPWFIGSILFVWLAVQRERWRWTIGAGVCVGMLALIGVVHLILILGVLLASYVAYHTVCALVVFLRDRSTGWRPIVRPTAVVAGAMMLGVLIGAVQLVPARALSKESVRQEMDREFVTRGSAHPIRNTIQLVAPYYYGNVRLGYWGELTYNGMAHYTGVVMLLGAVLGLCMLGRDRHLWFLVVLAAVGLIVAAGRHTPVYNWLCHATPLFAQLRNPTRIFWCTDIALACLGAVGIDRVLARPSAEARRRSLPWVSIGASALVVATVGWTLLQLHRYADAPEQLVRWVGDIKPNLKRAWLPQLLAGARSLSAAIFERGDLAVWGNVVAIVAAAVLVPILVLRRRPMGMVPGVALVVILVGELFAVSFGMVQYDPKYEVLTSTPPRVQWLQENLGFHRYALGQHNAWPRPNEIGGYRSMQFRLLHAYGSGGGIYDSAERTQFIAVTRQSPKLMSIAGVRFLASERNIEHPRLPRVRMDERYTFYENLDCLPLVYFVKRVVEVSTAKQAIGTLIHDQFAPREMALVYGAPPPDTAQSRATRTEVKSVSMVPGRWEIETETDAPAQLVVSEGFSPGWRCRINGAVAAIRKTNDQFMSVAVPAGAARVVLKYAPPEFHIGAVLSVSGIVAALGLAFVRPRRRQQTTPPQQAPADAKRRKRGRRAK